MTDPNSEIETYSPGPSSYMTNSAQEAYGVGPSRSSQSVEKPKTARSADPFLVNVDELVFSSEVLGSGGFGKVMAADWAGTPVAVKRLRKEAHEQFVREMGTLQHLRHPNIVLCLGVTIEHPWILFERMERHMDVKVVYKNFNDVLRVAVDVARAMAYAHSRGFVHRDLKPSNILMDGKGTYKVSDWGLSRSVDPSGNMTGDTGTPAYMAPEVIRSDRYSAKCDVYSYGIFLWALVSGTTVPYPLFTPVQAAAGVVKKGLRPPVPKRIDPDYIALMIRCWDADETVRPDFVEIATKISAIEAETLMREKEKLTRKSSWWYG